MIARPHICLRCQLRLARRRPPTPSKFQAAYQSTDAKGFVPSSRESNTSRRPLLDRTSQDGEFKDMGRARDGRAKVSEYPMGKLYGFLGQLQREKYESLKDIKTLGDPAEVIVLRESKPESIDILATLDNEMGLAGQKEVDENINHLRPGEGQKPQNWEEFNALLHELESGFTTSQLARYIQSFRVDVEDGQVFEDAVLDAIIPRISPWMPETSDSLDTFKEDITRGYSLESYTGKQRVAMRLLRECWKLELPELENGIGEIELELHPGDLDLLLHDVGRQSILQMISSAYETSIEAIPIRNALRITATREESEYVIKEIREELKNVRRIQMSLGALVPPNYLPWEKKRWMENNFDQTTLSRLSELTKTKIENSNGKLSISCIDHNAYSSTSNRADTALRLMLASADFPNRTTQWLGVRRGSKSRRKAKLISCPDNEALSWRGRLRKWVRLTKPINKDSQALTKATSGPAPSQELENMDEHAQEADMKELETPAGPEPPPAAELEVNKAPTKSDFPFFWTTKTFTHSSAVYGSILHSLPPKSTQSLSALHAQNLTQHCDQTFFASVPGISRFLDSWSPSFNSPTSTESLLMRFIPNPLLPTPARPTGVGAQALSVFPPIEMRLSIDPESNALTLRDIQAIHSISNSDLMMPDSSVDIRFEQRTFSRLRSSLSRKFPNSIMQFIADSNLNIRGSQGSANGKLETPAKVLIPIASHLCRGDGLALLGLPDNTATHEVEYLFAGLEMRNTMVLEFDGWKLQYTSIEAGRANGRRGELRLRPSRAGLPSIGEPAYREAEFVDSALKLVDVLDGAVDTAIKKYKVDAPVSWERSGLRRVKFVGSEPEGRKSFYFARRIDFGEEARVKMNWEDWLESNKEWEMDREQEKVEERR